MGNTAISQDIAYLKKRNVQEFIHFTSIDNLQSIANNGLMPRTFLNQKNIKYTYNDGNRFDGLNHLNLSITNPNIDMFYRFRKSNPNTIYVVISLNIDLLNYLQLEDYYFTSTNAASTNAQRVNVEELFIGHRGALPENCPTDNQAELIVKKPIPTKYINAIYVDTYAAQHIVSTIFPEVDVLYGDAKHRYRKGLVKPNTTEGLHDLFSIDEKITKIIQKLSDQTEETEKVDIKTAQKIIIENQLEIEKMLHDVYLTEWGLTDQQFEQTTHLFRQNKASATFDTYAVLSNYFEDRHYDKSTSRKPIYWKMHYAPTPFTLKKSRSAAELSALAVLEKIINRGRATRLSPSLEQFLIEHVETAKLQDTVRYAHQIQSALVELLKVQNIHVGDTISIEGVKPIIAQAIFNDVVELEQHIAKLYRVSSQFINIAYVETDATFILSNENFGDKYISIFPCTKPISFVKDFIRIQEQVDVEINETVLAYLLQYIFGFNKFRPNQIDGIIRALQHEDSIVLLPTGSGKSIIYQLLALITPGIAFIIDPIVSLAYDQVDNLYRKGIDRVTELVSDTEDKEQVLEDIGRGQYFMSFVAPERFQMQSFRNSIAYYARTNLISVIAIDEAHCVSEWGHDFRTAYLSLANTCRTICKTGNNTSPPLLALTGTASASVLRDMQRDLNILDEEAVIQPESFDRKEIEFRVVNCQTNQKATVLQKIIKQEIPSFFGQSANEFYQKQGEQTACGLVFCAIAGENRWRNGNFHPFGTRHIQSLLNDWLPTQSCGVYNGQVRSKEKKENARLFKNNELLALSATKSYGMGIDKPNIRWAVHYGISPSIESYYQEAGRCARDGEKAVSWIILSNDYPDVNLRLLDSTKTPVHQLQVENDRIKGDKPWEGDDLSRTIFFHASSFSGIEEELNHTKFVLSYLLNDNYCVPFKQLGKSTLEKTIYRLVLIGYVEDYTVNYTNNTFDIVTRRFSPNIIEMHYQTYISGYQQDEGYVAAQLQLLKQATATFEKSPEHYLLAAVKTLLNEFTYKIVEEGRRIAMRNMLIYSSEAASITDPKEGGEYLRRKIVDYLSTSEEIRVQDLISKATDFKFLNTFVQKIPSKKAAQKMLAQLNRLLEAYPEHFGLYYVMFKTQLKYSSIEEALIAMNAALRYGVKSYNIEKNTLYKQLITTVCNYAKDQHHYNLIIQSVELELGDVYVQQLLQQNDSEALHLVYQLNCLHKLSIHAKEIVSNGTN